MLPAIFWLSMVLVTFTDWRGTKQTAELIVGGFSEAECLEAVANVRHFGKAAGTLGGLIVKKIKATECAPMVAEPAEEVEE